MPIFRCFRYVILASGVAAILAAPLWPLPLYAQEAPPAAEVDGTGLEAVEQAYRSGDLAAARTGLLPLAEAGNGIAQYRLGFMMANAEGGPFDRAGAIKWLEAAQAQGSAPSVMLLAQVYLSGNPEEPDYARAAELLSLAVDAGDLEAHFYLAQLFRAGRGVEGDAQVAAQLMEVAARGKFLPAQFSLAQMYSRGEGVEQDAANATRWLFEAADAGHGPAQMSLYTNYSQGLGFPKDEAKALVWLKKAAEDGFAEAEHVLGSNYLLGQGGVEEDTVRGVAYLVRAAEKGNAGAQSNLGYAYMTGTGVPADVGKAFRWYKAAADQGLVRAAVAVASLYESGSGTEADLDAALTYYRYADSRGNDLAAQALGRLVVAGSIDAEVDPESAPRWVAQAADAGAEGALDWLQDRAGTGDMSAHLLLGLLYHDSEAVPQSPEEAVRHMRIAAEAGVVLAQYQMGLFNAEGFWLEQNLVKAHVWMNIAASNGSDAAVEKRNAYAALLTPEQIAEAQDRARGRLRGGNQ